MNKLHLKVAPIFTALWIGCVSIGVQAMTCGEIIIDEAITKEVRNQTFLPVVQRFLGAVAKRDRKAFTEFFQSGDDFYALLPGDKEFHDTATFLKSQEGLFGANPPKVTQELKRVIPGDKTGVAVVLVTVEPNGAPVSQSLVTVVFVQEQGTWLIKHIQNTVTNAAK